MFYLLLILPIFGLDDVQLRRSIICGCKYLSPQECIEVEWCELASQFDKCPINSDCLTYETEQECEEADASLCVWKDAQCLNKCQILEYNTCQNKEIDSNCSQFNTTSSCEALSWCQFNINTSICEQKLQVPCSDIFNSIECEDYGCEWVDDLIGCQNNDGNCSKIVSKDDCVVSFEGNRQCIWIEKESGCFQSKECGEYKYDKDELDLCESISNCHSDENQCQSCVQDMFTFESILELISIFYLF
ncbi:unnamed protein product [Paramecium octaurelia]|uniref:Uncharacterized protein n=1 Tax=Paramecium octaurelia TaxID=43137 RepID=A0A8S1U3U9_PAROT|nr:unnamed protein product [Paramecium octaurelia]